MREPGERPGAGPLPVGRALQLMELQPAEARDGRRQRAIHDAEPVAPFRVGPADASTLELAGGPDLQDGCVGADRGVLVRDARRGVCTHRPG